MKTRRSLRTKLTLLYAVPFFFSGAALLSVPILQTRVTEPVGGQGIPGGGGAPAEDHQRLLAVAGVALAVMLVVAVVLGWLIAGRFLRPLRTITATAQDISASNLHRRLGPTGRNDEFTELAETLDNLFERLESAFESQRHFVANASHELRTPLTAERTLLQVALADPDATVDTLRLACQDVLELSAAQERLINSLLILASSEQGIEQREVVDLAEIASQVVQSRPHRGLQVVSNLESAEVTGDPNLIESLIANLVDNALRHNVPGGWVQISTATATDHAIVRVTNSGPAVPAEELGRLFQPFQRLGAQRVQHVDGHGLGLAIVRAIADAHGATLTPQARPEGGLDLEVRLPGPRGLARRTGDAATPH